MARDYLTWRIKSPGLQYVHEAMGRGPWQDMPSECWIPEHGAILTGCQPFCTHLQVWDHGKTPAACPLFSPHGDGRQISGDEA